MWTNLKDARSRGLIVTIGIIFVICAIWLFTALTGALNHIMPGLSISASTSMEPYELNFATQVLHNELLQKNIPPLEWRLKIPRAFLVDLGGKNGLPNRGHEARNFFRADFHAVVFPDNSGLSPAVFEIDNKPIKQFVAINIYNSSADPNIVSFDACLTNDNYKKFMESHGAKEEHDRRCLPQESRCDIYSHLDGWYVQMTVTRDLYANPESVCRVVKTFLNAHTVHRDDLR
jgi:hypothetical protein